MKIAISLLLITVIAAIFYFSDFDNSKESNNENMLQLGDFAFQEKRYQDAFEWYQHAANQGISEGQLSLSQMYKLGLGVEKDEGIASHWLKLAAEQGLTKAEYKYAALLESNAVKNKTSLSEAASWYKKSATQGYPEAMLKLSSFYFLGKGIEKNTYQALSWVRKAEEKATPKATVFHQQVMSEITKLANRGDLQAQYMLATAYQNGQGVPKDLNTAQNWLTKAAQQGHAEAQYTLAKILIQLDKPDWENGNYWLRQASEQGHIQAGYTQAALLAMQNNPQHAAAQTSWRWLYHGLQHEEPSVLYNLAIILKDGLLALPQTDDNYAYWLKKAAQGGISTAQNDLGVYLKLEQQSTKESISWLTKAAHTDNKSQFNLGLIYARGDGITPDDDAALYWWKEAEKNGNIQAKVMLGLLYNLGRGVGRSEKEAVVWYEKAAASKNLNAIYNLGVLYYNGRGIDRNYSTAAQYFETLAYQGDIEAQNIYASLYLEGLGVKYNPKTALSWFQRAAKAGSVNAMFNLAIQYRRGNGTEQDDKKALAWYKKAANLGFSPAQNAMGYMYAEGRGTKVNKDIAAEWFQKASNNGLRLATQNLSELNGSQSFSLVRLQINNQVRADILNKRNIDLSKWLEIHHQPIL